MQPTRTHRATEWTPPTWNQQPPTWTPSPQPYTAPPRKRRRIFPWVFLGIQVLFLVLIISAAHSGHTHNIATCATQQTGLSQQDCQSASDAGTAIGVGLLVGFWVAFDIIVGGTYAIVRLARRDR